MAFSDLDAGAVTTAKHSQALLQSEPTNAAVIDYVGATIPSLSVTEASVTSVSCTGYCCNSGDRQHYCSG